MHYLKSVFFSALAMALCSSAALACSSNAGGLWEISDDRGWTSKWHRVCSKFGEVENPDSTFRGVSTKQGFEPIESELVITVSQKGEINILRKDRASPDAQYKPTCVYEGIALVYNTNNPASAVLKMDPRSVGGTYLCDGMQAKGSWRGDLRF